MMVTFRTYTAKAIDFIYTCSTIITGAGCAFINIHITTWACKSRFASTVVAINAINAVPVNAWVTCTVIKVILTVHS